MVNNCSRIYIFCKVQCRNVNLFLFLGQEATFLRPFIGCLHTLHFGTFLFGLLLLVSVDVVGTAKNNSSLVQYMYCIFRMFMTDGLDVCLYCYLGLLEEHSQVSCYP